MSDTKQKRFYMRGSDVYDGGVKISEQALLQYLQRQWRAMEHNKTQGLIGAMGNKILMPEYENAHEVYRTLRPDLYQNK